MAERFFCGDLPIGGPLTLQGEEAHHLRRVRRLGLGEVVEVFDGRGGATLARIVALRREGVELVAIGQPLPDRLPPFRLTLATAVPKGDRFDWLVEKATELGVARLVPLVTERSVVEPRAAKLERLRRRIVEAAKQCGRNRLMDLGEPTAWATFVLQAADPPRLMAHPGGLEAAAWPRPSGSATLAVGPEGGFGEAEVAAARAAGWQAIGLGSTLLRVETAGLAGCSILMALCERSDG